MADTVGDDRCMTALLGERAKQMAPSLRETARRAKATLFHGKAE